MPLQPSLSNKHDINHTYDWNIVVLLTVTWNNKSTNNQALNMVFIQLDMCLWDTDAPNGNKVKIWQKSLSPTFLPRPIPEACEVSEV